MKTKSILTAVFVASLCSMPLSSLLALVVGDTVQRIGSGKLNIRQSPSTGATSIGMADLGNTGTIIDGPQNANGYWWWKIKWNFPVNVTGWSVENDDGPTLQKISVYTLTVASSNPNSGVSIPSSTLDNNTQAGGTTPFTRTFSHNATATYVAPATAPNGNIFQKWTRNGTDYSSSRTATVTLSKNYTMTAVYASAPPVSALAVGDTVQRIGSGALHIRQSPSTGATSIGMADLGNTGTIIDGPQNANGYWWWKIKWNFPVNVTGWSVENDDGPTLQKISVYTLTVASSNPNSGVSIPSSTLDNNTQAGGTTSFTRTFSHNATATYVAPATAPNGNIFQKWVYDSIDLTTSNTASVTVNANSTLTAIYGNTSPSTTITIISPIGGTIEPGKPYPVKWSVTGDTSKISSFFIDYSLDGGDTYAWAGGAASSYLQINWPVPGSVSTTNGKIRVRAVESSGNLIAQAVSNTFTIAQPAQKPTARIDYSNKSPAPNEKITFSSSKSRAVSPATLVGYFWEFSDGTTSHSANPDKTFAVSGGTGVGAKLTVTDSLGATDTASVAFTISGQGVGTPTTETTYADPVNLATGNYFYEHDDLKIAGRGFPFVFKRFYNAKDAASSGDAPMGWKWTHSYHVFLSSTGDGGKTVTYGDGSSVAFARHEDGSYEPEPGVFDRLTENAGVFTLTKKTQTAWRFDSQGRLASITDKNGNVLALSYGSGGALETITDTAGRMISFTNDASGRITEITDPLNRKIIFEYDAEGNLIAATDARGKTTRYTYDADHQMLTATDPNGNIFVKNEYDEMQRVVKAQRDAYNNQTLFAYDFETGVTTVTDPFDNTEYHTHDDKLRIVSVTDALGNTESYQYDGQNNRTKVIDRNHRATSYEYDAHGNVTRKTDPASNSTTITYDALDNPLTRTDCLGHTTQFAYDAKGNLIRTTDALGNIVEVAYTAHGQPATVTDPRGKTTANVYDAQGNLTQITDPLGAVTQYTYDAVGRQLSRIAPLGRTGAFSYDENDNLVKTTDALGGETIQTYDDNGNRIKMRDPKGNETLFAYDAKDRLISVMDALGNVTNYAYDAMDRKISVTTPGGGVTQNTYDAVGNLVAVTDPLGNTSNFAYDAAKNRVSATDRRGKTTTFTYDALDRLIRTTDPLGHATVIEYDSIGRRTKVTDANNRTTAFAYDTLGRLIGVTDAGGGVVSYTYDEAGNRKSMKDPNNNTTTYDYDALGRLISTQDPSGGVLSHTLDPLGNRVSRKDPNGAVTTYTYDVNNRLTGIQYPGGNPVGFTYDANDNRIAMSDGLGSSSFEYDALNRMTQSTDAFGKTVRYTYDEDGNRESIRYPDDKTVTYTYDLAGRLILVRDWLNNVTTYAYDTAGNVLSATNPNGTKAVYGYDDNGRLTNLANSLPGGGFISDYSLTSATTCNPNKTSRWNRSSPQEPPITPTTTTTAFFPRTRLLPPMTPTAISQAGAWTASATTTKTASCNPPLEDPPRNTPTTESEIAGASVREGQPGDSFWIRTAPFPTCWPRRMEMESSQPTTFTGWV